MAGSSVGENEVFVTLIQVAREDAEVRSTLLSILSLDSFNRKSFLGGWAGRMRLQGAPEDFVQALLYLRDDQVAAKALEILRESN